MDGVVAEGGEIVSGGENPDASEGDKRKQVFVSGDDEICFASEGAFEDEVVVGSRQMPVSVPVMLTRSALARRGASFSWMVRGSMMNFSLRILTTSTSSSSQVTRES
jgi:hypothetical protein